jgi:hypothetical protein
MLLMPYSQLDDSSAIIDLPRKSPVFHCRSVLAITLLMCNGCDLHVKPERINNATTPCAALPLDMFKSRQSITLAPYHFYVKTVKTVQSFNDE